MQLHMDSEYKFLATNLCASPDIKDHEIGYTPDSMILRPLKS